MSDSSHLIRCTRELFVRPHRAPSYDEADDGRHGTQNHQEHRPPIGVGKRGKVAPKYRNPADHSQTWSGRGRQPRWFKAALRKGKTERSLLIP